MIRLLAATCVVSLAAWLLLRTGEDPPPPDSLGPTGADALHEAVEPLPTEGKARVSEDPAAQTADVTVSCRDPEGDPAPGMTVEAWSRAGLVAQTATDPTGEAFLRGLTGSGLTIFVVYPNGQHVTVATLDAKDGDRRFQVEVEALREVVIRCRMEGRPGLPAGELRTKPALIRPAREKMGGNLRGRFRPPPGAAWIRFRIRADGYVPRIVWGRIPEVGPIPIEVDLAPACELLVRWENHPATAGFELVREDATGAFRPITSSLRTGWDTLLPLGKQYVNLEPGRYTVRMNDTAALRGDVRLDGDHRKGVIDLELLQRAFVSGRVVLPAGHSFGDVRVRMEGDRQDPGGVGGGMFHGLAAPQPGVFPVNPDGTFHIPVPGDRPVRLVPYHPALSAAPDGGSVTTREGRTGVVLRLEAAGLITFRLPTSFPMPKLGASDRNVRILLFPGGPSGKPTFHGWAVAGKGGYRIGGWRPGTATIWIDVPGSVPIILRDQELPAEGLDFGELPVRAGTRVHVRWLAAKDKLDFWKGVDIERIDGPHFRRSNSPMDTLWKPGVESGEVITVSGLSAGRYRLLTTQKGGPQAVRHLDEIIEVDGESDLWRTVEFR